MLRAYQLQFVAEVTEEQRLLNGTRSLALEGETTDGSEAWTLILSVTQAKEAEVPLLEGDLTLSGPPGELFAGLARGRIVPEFDEVSGGEQEALDLHLRIEGGEGGFAGAAGSVHLSGTLKGGEAELGAEVEIEAAAEEADSHGRA